LALKPRLKPAHLHSVFNELKLCPVITDFDHSLSFLCAPTQAAFGLTNATAKATPVTVVYSLAATGVRLQKSQTMSYTATKGKSGSAK
jgi:hypothetical protein